MNPHPVQDRAKALELLMDREPLLQRLEAAFVADIPDEFAELREAVEAGDSALATRLAHSIKGQAATIGALAAAEAARGLEFAAREGASLANLRQGVSGLGAALDVLSAAIRARSGPAPDRAEV